MSTRARLCIREVARELEEDMELGAEGDLNAAAPSTARFPPAAPSTASFPPPSCSRSLAVVSAVLSVAVVTATVARLYSTPANGSLLNGSLLGPTSHACTSLNRIGRLCRLVPPVRAESKG